MNARTAPLLALLFVLFPQGACSESDKVDFDENGGAAGGRSGNAGTLNGGGAGSSGRSNGGSGGSRSGAGGAAIGGDAGESGEGGAANGGSGEGGSAVAGSSTGGSDSGGAGGRGSGGKGAGGSRSMGGAGNGGAASVGGANGVGGHAGGAIVSGASGVGDAGGGSGGSAGGAGAGGAGAGGAGAGGDAGCLPRPTGLVSFWPGDGNANDVQDGNTGVLENGTTFASGKVLAGFFFDGVDDRVNVGNAANLRVSSGDFTVDAWVSFRSTNRPSGVGTAPSGDMSIVDKMNTSAINADGWRLLKQDDGHFWFCFGAASNGCSGGLSTTVRSSTVITAGNLNNWFHVAATKAGSTASIYVNGIREGSTTLTALVDTGTADLVFGTYRADGAFLNGQLDEVHLFNRALGEPEILAIHAAGARGLCKP